MYSRWLHCIGKFSLCPCRILTIARLLHGVTRRDTETAQLTVCDVGRWLQQAYQAQAVHTVQVAMYTISVSIDSGRHGDRARAPAR